MSNIGLSEPPVIVTKCNIQPVTVLELSFKHSSNLLFLKTKCLKFLLCIYL